MRERGGGEVGRGGDGGETSVIGREREIDMNTGIRRFNEYHVLRHFS